MDIDTFSAILHTICVTLDQYLLGIQGTLTNAQVGRSLLHFRFSRLVTLSGHDFIQQARVQVIIPAGPTSKLSLVHSSKRIQVVCFVAGISVIGMTKRTGRTAMQGQVVCCRPFVRPGQWTEIVLFPRNGKKKKGV